MAENPRIDELRKRLEKEPASRLFAQLAEELRKAGDLEESIQVCRAGLEKHANYTSARMTLGRALMDTGDAAGARVEFEAVVKAAPDNILASRLLGECLEGLGDLNGALKRYKTTLALAPGEKQVLARIEAVEAGLKGPPPAAQPVAPAAPQLPVVASGGPSADAGVPEDDAITLRAKADPFAPIPLVAVDDESFELEPPYASPTTAVGGAPPPAASTAPAPAEVDQSFEIEPAYAAPTTFVREEPAVAAPAPPPLPPPPLATLPEPVTPSEPPAPPSPPPEPAPELASSTLAELYFNQGHTARAIEVYRQLLEREPGNERARARLTELVALEKHLQAEERAAPRGEAPLDPRAARRAAIERVIGRLEGLLVAVRKG